MSLPKHSNLRIDAEPGVSIVVVDSELVPVAESVGRLDKQLPIGLYGLQFTAGHGFDEDVVRLGSDGLTYRAAAIDFATPIPVASPTAPDAAILAIAEASHRPTERFGTGSELLIAVTDDGRLTGANLAAGLSLLDADGRRVANLATRARRSGPREHPAWAVACIECDPGAYRLRGSTGSLTLEQTIMLVGGWQTQVFLDRKSWGGVSRRRRASLPDASVAMARRGIGFDPARPDLRLTELARIALLDRRQVIGEEDLADMVYGKFDNPMLGLYSAFVMLSGGPGPTLVGDTALSSTTRSLLDEIRENLRDLLGKHPDVMALDVLAGEEVEQVRTPPMLRAGWEALITASAERPDLVAANSLAGRIAEQLFGSGVWLTWRKGSHRGADDGLTGKTHAAREGRRPPATNDLGDAVQRLSEAVVGYALTEPAAGDSRSALSPAAQSALALATAVSREPSGKGSSLAQADLTNEAVVEALAVPRSIAEQAFSDALSAVEEG
jgi:hypothetical protein